MKKIALTLFFYLLIVYCLADSLPVWVDANRFLSESQQTILEINFQIAYRNLEFLSTTAGFTATFETDFSIFKGTDLVYNDTFINKIIVSDEAKTLSDMLFSDKISMDLTKSDFRFIMQFRDMGSQRRSVWEYDFSLLPANALVSDLEFSFQVTSTSASSQDKFQRGSDLFHLNASHIYLYPEAETAILFFELYNLSRDENGYHYWQEEVILKKKDEIKFSDINKLSSPEKRIQRILPVSLLDLEDGYFTVDLKITDLLSGHSEVKSDFLSLKKPVLFNERMFVDLDDEFKLVSYFLQGTQLKTWKTLSETGKINYFNRFWAQNDPDPATERNEFFDEIRSRIEYCNQKFSHFSKGWTTDRGRIYLKNGAPDEIMVKDTGLYTKYSQKEYEIWKYRTKMNKTYIFIDLQMSGNFRMIYADGDSGESSTVNWSDYLGEDFDFNLLE